MYWTTDLKNSRKLNLQFLPRTLLGLSCIVLVLPGEYKMNDRITPYYLPSFLSLLPLYHLGQSLTYFILVAILSPTCPFCYFLSFRKILSHILDKLFWIDPCLRQTFAGVKEMLEAFRTCSWHSSHNSKKDRPICSHKEANLASFLAGPEYTDLRTPGRNYWMTHLQSEWYPYNSCGRNNLKIQWTLLYQVVQAGDSWVHRRGDFFSDTLIVTDNYIYRIQYNTSICVYKA